MNIKEELEPELKTTFFASIKFGTDLSSSASSASSAASFCEITPIALEERVASNMSKSGKVSAGGQAVQGGQREVYNPYTRRNVVFGSGFRDAAAVNPGALKKRRVATTEGAAAPNSIRDEPEEEEQDEFSQPEGLADMAMKQYDDYVAAREAEEEGRKNVSMGGMGGEADSQRSHGEVSGITTESVLREEERVGTPRDLHNVFENANMYEDIVTPPPVPLLQINPNNNVQRNIPRTFQNVQVVQDDDGSDIDRIARTIREGNDGARFEDGEREEIEDLTSNSRKYVKRIDSILKRFLATASERCGPDIRDLALGWHVHRNGERVPLLMMKISGERHGSKKVIINSIMVQVALSWRLERKNKDKVAGDFPESTTWDQWLKLLQSSFRSYNVRYSLKTDFFGKGEFHGVLEKFYRQEKRKNPKFGTGRYASDCPEGIEDLILAAIEEGTLDLDDRIDLQMVCYYLVGVRLCLRGGTECHDRVWEEFEFIKETEEDGEHNYVRLTIAETVAKGMQITVRGKFCCLYFLFILFLF